MSSEAVPVRARRGRPLKFGRPSRLVAVTLPEEVIRGLRKSHPDLAWAIVSLFEKRSPAAGDMPIGDAELVNIGDRQSLIVVNRAVFKRLPGVNIVPVAADRAFLALEPGCGVNDLEAALLRRLAVASLGDAERTALVRFRRQLKSWRHDQTLRFHIRSIIVVERVRPRRGDGSKSTRSTNKKEPR